MALEKAKVFTIASVKGGTGKTTTLLNLAGAFSLQKKKVLIIDLDLYGGAIALSLNISNEQDIYRLVDDLSSNRFENIDRYLVKYNDDIDVIPSPKDPRNASKVGSKYISVVLSKVIYRYDVILIDTNHFLNDITLVALDASDQVLYVVNNDPANLKNMATRIAIHKDMEQDNYKIILNDASHPGKDQFSKYDVKNILKEGIDYIIPKSFYLKNIDKYVLAGSILTLNKGVSSKHRKTIEGFKNMATSLMKEKK